jgi:hypothetical protein
MTTATRERHETLLDRLRGPSYADKEQWLEARRQGVTATEVRDLAKGNGADRRRIKIEKLTGERESIVGNQYIDRGNEREPVIAAWILENFDIAPNDHVFIDAELRALCTPDGISNDFVDDGILAEIKTSKHDLTPAAHAMLDGKVLEPKRVTQADRGGHFWQTGYYDQMQWQMLVLRAERTLFVWEQHDSNWPNPSPVHDAPQWCWVYEDNERQLELLEIARDFLAEIDATRPSDVPTVGNMTPEIATIVADLLKFRDDEAVAAAGKKAAWDKLQAQMLAEGKPDVQLENDSAKLSVTTSTKQEDVDVLDEAAMRAKAPRLVAQYEALVARHTRRETRTSTSRKLNVVAKKNPNK